MTTEIKEQQLSLNGITGGHTPVVDIFRKMAPGYPTPGPAEFSQTPITSTSANLASSTAAGGNNRRGPSLYTSHAAKSGNFEATTRCSQNLGGLSLRVSQLFPVSETPTENQKNKNKVCRNRRTF